jgi:hypothetical protein
MNEQDRSAMAASAARAWDDEEGLMNERKGTQERGRESSGHWMMIRGTYITS